MSAEGAHGGGWPSWTAAWLVGNEPCICPGELPACWGLLEQKHKYFRAAKCQDSQSGWPGTGR